MNKTVTIAPGEDVLRVENVSRQFARGSGGGVQVLDDVNLTLRKGEIVGILGRSGSGKSTLLRIIAGLMKPSGGDVIYQGSKVTGPCEGAAMVFQTFALFPWLTVLENVEAGLEAQSVPPKESRSSCAEGHRPHRARRFRIRLSARDFRRHAPARRLRARARRRANDPFDGRTLLGARCADRGNAAHRPSRTLGRSQASHPVDPARHA